MELIDQRKLLSVARSIASILRADDELILELANFALHPVHRVPTYYFRMIHVGSREELGAINLRVGYTPHIELYAGHVGYTVHPVHRGNRYAARSLRLLIPVARKVGLNPLWITCDPDNFGSRRSCELAGAQFIEIVDVPGSCVIRGNGHEQKCRYRLDSAGIVEPVGSSRTCKGSE